MSWNRSFIENPRRHANIGVVLALALIGAAVVCESRHGEQGNPAALLLFLASYPLAAYGCAGYAASKGYGVWWGILPALLGLNLLALNHLTNLPDRGGTVRGASLVSRIVDGFLLLLTSAMVFALLACATLAWGGGIEPEYRLPGKIGVVVCLAYFFWLFCLGRMAASPGEKEPGSWPDESSSPGRVARRASIIGQRTSWKGKREEPSLQERPQTRRRDDYPLQDGRGPGGSGGPGGPGGVVPGP